MDESPRLSKSRFTAGLQCRRQLWWRTHEPEAPELTPDPERQAVLDQGHRIGRLACDYVPGGVLIDVPHTDPDERVRQTARAMEDGAAVVYEACFVADRVFVAVDILERIPTGWRLIEVKSSARVKSEHLDDVAVQLHVLRAAGLKVPEAQLMHLNRECRYPDLSNLFVRENVIEAAEARLPAVPGRIRSQLLMLAGPLPAVPIGPQCHAPNHCPFVPRCWKDVPAHHVSTLYGSGSIVWELAAQGVTTIDQIADGVPLGALAERQRLAVRAGRRSVEPGLAAALAAIESPIAVLDFETVAPPVPTWPGCRPFDQVPAQFSVHVEDGAGGWIHHGWLADDEDDPRPEMVRRVTEALSGARTVLAYYADFERRCLTEAAAAHPELAESVAAVNERLVDALSLVRDYVYDPAFLGSFSLKRVLPVLVPELSYASLPIAGGGAASRGIERLLFDGDALSADERARMRADLTRYCAFDTMAVVRLLEVLRAMAAEASANGIQRQASETPTDVGAKPA